MVIAIIHLLTLHVRYLKLTATTARIKPVVDLINIRKETIDVGVFLLFVVLTMSGEETQVAHVLYLQQFGVIPRHIEEVKETVEEVKQVEANT